MNSKYIAAADVILDGAELKDVKRVREGRRVLRKQVKVMRRRGSIRQTPNYMIELDTLIPEDGPGYDYESIEDKTLTIEYDNGTKAIYLGVSTLEVGDEEFDDDNETIRKVTLVAADRKVQ